MDIIVVWLIDVAFSFSAGLCMHCYVSHTFSVTQYLFILFLVSRPGIVLSVYHASHVCGNVRTVAALCWIWLESAEPLRTVMRVFQ
jgi:uncharacterized membrane protein